MSGEERSLGQIQTAWVRGATDSKMGHAVLTSDRILFFDTKFMGGAAGGALGFVLAEHMQKRHENGGPLFELPLGSITRVERRKKMLNKNRIALTTSDGEYLLNDGWSAWHELLRKALTEDAGRRVVDDGPGTWRVEPA